MRARRRATSATPTSTTPSGSPSTRPAAWPSRRSSTRSKKTCPTTKTRANGTGRRWPQLVNTRWKLNLRDRDLKKIGRDKLAEELIEDGPRGDRRSRPVEACTATWSPTYGVQTRLRLDARQVRRRARPGRSAPSSSRASSCELAHEKAGAGVRRARSPNIPVLAGLYRFTARDASGAEAGLRPRGARRVGPAAVRRRARASTTSRTSSATKFARCSSSTASRTTRRPTALAAEAQQRVDAAVRRRRRPRRRSARSPASNGKLDDLAAWLKTTLQCRAHERRAGAARSRSGPAQSCRRSSKITSAPKCGGWSGRCCCRSSTGLERAPAGDGPPAVQRRPARLRPGRSQGRVQARRHAAVRRRCGTASATT